MKKLPLLKRRSSAGKHSATLFGQIKEEMLDVGSLVQHIDQRLTVDDKSTSGGRDGGVLALIEVEGERTLRGVPAPGVQLDHLHLGCEQPAAVRDVDGSLLLVPGEHPDHDARLPQPSYHLRHSLLQPVFDARRPHQPHLVLQPVVRVCEQLVPLLKCVFSRVVLAGPSLVLLLIETPHSRHQDAESDLAPLVEVSLRRLKQVFFILVLRPAQSGDHGTVRSLAQKLPLPGVGVS